MKTEPANILLVDDREANLVALRSILEPLGLGLVSATSGAAALKCLLRTDFALILLDVEMPGLDGFETAALIKQREKTRHVPIIFLTARDEDRAQASRGYEAGAVDYMSKPFEPAILRSKVTVFVELREKTDALARARLERRHADRLRALAEASIELNAARSLDEVLTLLTEHARRILGAAQASTETTQDEGEGQRTRVVTSAQRGRPDRDPADAGVALEVRRSRRPLRLSGAELRARAPAGWDAPRGWLGAPLLEREGGETGLIQLSGPGTAGFSDSDEAVLVQLAQLGSSAIESVRLLEHARGIAETLQRSLLPGRLPDLPGVAVAARYVPGATGMSVGGDWYDVIPLSGGRLGLALGDVVGRGVRAASVMGQLRTALRAYAVEDHPPGEVARRLDVLATGLDLGLMTTFVYLVYDPATTEVRFTCAGHLPPLLVSGQGDARYLEGGRSVPLGLGLDAAAPEGSVHLGQGDTLLLYTDGLVERRGESLSDGLARLAHAATEAPGELEPLCEHLLAAGMDAQTTDDVAILALRSTCPLARLELAVPAQASELAPLRHAVGRWLDERGADADDAFAITAALGEACANAVEHPQRPREGLLHLEAEHAAGIVTISVRDSGRWREPREDDRGRGLGLIEALMDGVEIGRHEMGSEMRIWRRLHGRAIDAEPGTVVVA